MASSLDFTPLKEACFAYPCIDNHTHNILKAEFSQEPPLHIMTTEANGPALQDVWYGLSHLRGQKMLLHLYGLPEDATWEDMLEAREKIPYEEMCKMNFKPLGIQCLLLDTGIQGTTCYDYKWHDRLTTSPTKVVIRLEPLVEEIVTSILSSSKSESPETIRATIKSEVQSLVLKYVADPEVVGFKSIAAYLTGLDIVATPEEEGDPVCGLDGLLEQWKASSKVKIRREDKPFEDWMIRTTLPLMKHKPLQFHVGLGSNPLILAKADPALLQSLAETFRDQKIIMVHSGYPYTRQAGYMAMAFKNVYLDFGEVFPQVAGHGQRALLRELLELTPTSKLLWSTDAHHHPECYYLSTLQARAAMFEVLSEIVMHGELTVSEAVTAAQKMLFHNTNGAYSLGLQPIPTGLSLPEAHAALTATPTALTVADLETSGINFVRIQWLDSTNSLRFRAIPVARFIRMATTDSPRVKALTQSDIMADSFSGSKEKLYMFDLGTLKKVPDDVAEGHASIMGWFEQKESGGSWLLRRVRRLLPKSWVFRRSSKDMV